MDAHSERYNFDPDWVSPPGDTLRDILDEKSISVKKLAHLLDDTVEFATALLKGSAEITDTVAEKLAIAFGPSVKFWKNRELRYREGLKNGKTDGRGLMGNT